MPDLEKGLGQGRVPVVTMHDVRLEVEFNAQLQSGPREEAKTEGIVQVIVVIGVVIKPGTIEVALEIHKKGRYTVITGGINAAPLLRVAHPDPHWAEEGAQAKFLLVNAAVFGHHHDDLVPQRT